MWIKHPEHDSYYNMNTVQAIRFSKEVKRITLYFGSYGDDREDNVDITLKDEIQYGEYIASLYYFMRNQNLNAFKSNEAPTC